MTPAAQAQDYPTRPINVIVPFPAGGLTDVPARIAATMMSEKIGQNLVVENKTGATGTIGAAFAARAAPDGYTLFANSLADTQNIHFVPLTYSPVDDFAQIGWIVDGPPLVLIINAQLPYKSLARIDRRREGGSEERQFRHVRPGLLAGDGAGAAQYRGQDQHRRGALSRLRRRGARGRRRRDPGRIRLHLAGQAAGRRRQGPRAGGCGTRSGLRPGPTCRPSMNWATTSTSGVSSASPRRSKTPKPIIEYLNKQLNDVVQSDAFKTRVGGAGHDACRPTTRRRSTMRFIREETVRQGEIAKLAKATSPHGSRASKR